MTSFADLLQQGTAHAWLFVPTAILLGALHGLEPGHSKTMMAAFIVAVRGTVAQAVVLGLAAAVSHTLVVWVVALGGQYLGQGMNAETSEPYFQLASAVIVIAIALWMLRRTWKDQRLEKAHTHGHHGHDHGHHHGQEVRKIDTGHSNHTHDYDAVYSEGDHSHEGLDVGGGEYMDAHERAHASDIARRFKGQNVTTGQIIIFGLTGGLIPCPAAITVLLLCLQLKQLSLGAALVACFSIGLAVTMVSAGVLASISVRHVQKRWSGFSTFARRAPYASGVLMLLIALYMGYSGILGLERGQAPEAAAVTTTSGA